MIFPKNEHLKISIYTGSIVGTWPFLFEENSEQRQLYNVYSKFMFYYFIAFIITAITQLFILMQDDENGVQLIMNNLGVTLLYTITAIRVLSIRTKTVKNLIKNILTVEEDILDSNDEKVIDIYKFHVKQSQITSLLFIGNIMIETLCYFINFMYAEAVVKFDAVRNETIVVKTLPLSTWFPYDAQEHYLISFLIQAFNGTIGAIYVVFTDAFSFSMIIFPLGQIRILVHVLSNFSNYVDNIKGQIQCAQDEASFFTLRECILKHKKIIRYLKDYNNSVKNIMLLDFLQSSLQLASLAMELLLIEPTIFNIIIYTEFIICMLLRLFVYYWYANEIMLESIKISSAIYECNWYDEPPQVKQLMSLIILRANKPLVLDIGPFSSMTLNTFLGIIKTTYSYLTMMIIYR